MTIGGKINALVFSTAILISCLLAAYFAGNRYQVALDQLVEGSLARVLSRPDLQIDIYQRNQGSLEQVLDRFLQPPAASFAAAYNSRPSLWR